MLPCPVPLGAAASTVRGTPLPEGRAWPTLSPWLEPFFPALTTSDQPEPTSVFVYGTLMPGERWEAVARQGGAYHAQIAQLSGVVLADLRPEGYPALFADAQASVAVHGWLYTYDAASWPRALPFLDDLEGLHLSPPLYERVRVTVQTSGGPAQAWVYLYARAAPPARAGLLSGGFGPLGGRAGAPSGRPPADLGDPGRRRRRRAFRRTLEWALDTWGVIL